MDLDREKNMNEPAAKKKRRAAGWIVGLVLVLLASLFLEFEVVAEKEANMNYEVTKTEAEWQKQLTSEQYRVLRQKGTEAPHSGKYTKHHNPGTYVCVGCGTTLFSSDAKYDSGCGWPSFWKEEIKGNVETDADRSLGMVRTEILCSKCGGHLGHVFKDGPKPTGLRYCVNSASLSFVSGKTETATFGAGCFWCGEAVFTRADGVKNVMVGYTGGAKEDPTYEQVCSGKTGHAEVFQVEFDPAVISYDQLLELFWKMHDPTTPNRQGADVGTQYRSAIFYHSDAQRKTAEESKKVVAKALGKTVSTEISKATVFYKAENYHQDYFERNQDAPYCRVNITPKLRKLKLPWKSKK
jgi:peptide methionine sulfoxide reductase msrA/msrB